MKENSQQASKKLEFVLFMKMMEEHINQTINQRVFFLMFQKYMKDAFTVNYPVSLIKIFFSKWDFENVQYSACSSSHDRSKKNTRENKEFWEAILTDLSKAFDCICHNLLIAKLNSCGFNRNALKLIYDYLCDRLQKTKVGYSFSACLHIIYGVPEGSIVGLLLFNPLQDGGSKGSWFFHSNFWKLRNQLLKLFEFQFQPFFHPDEGHTQCQSKIIKFESRAPLQKIDFFGQIHIKLRL